MKKLFTLCKIITIIICALGLTSCFGTVTCPEFDENILSWAPYQKNDTIRLFSESTGSTMPLPIESVVVTHTSHYKKGTKCGGCEGGDNNIQVNNYNSDFQITIYYVKNKVTSQRYTISGSYFTTYSEIKNYLFEGREYDLVRIFESEQTRYFKKLIIAKDIGIIGLVDIYGNSWILKTDIPAQKSNKPDERGGIMINNISC